jgi:hypothetical protein
MADQDILGSYLLRPSETSFGTAGNIIAQNLPAVVNPYASPGSNFAAVLGGGLLAGLLAFGAKREAEAQNREMTPRILDLMGSQSQTELQQKMQQPGYEQLGGLGSRLQLSLMEAERQQAVEKAKRLAQVEAQKEFEIFKATDPNILAGVAQREAIKRQFSPQISPQTTTAIPQTLEQKEQEARMRERVSLEEPAKFALSELGRQAAALQAEQKQEAIKVKTDEQLRRDVEVLKQKQTNAQLTEQQKQENRKEIQSLQLEANDRKLKAQFEQQSKLLTQRLTNLNKNNKLSAGQVTDLQKIMDVGQKAQDVIKALKQVDNWAELKMAQLLPYFDKEHLAAFKMRELASRDTIQRTGAAAAEAEYARIQKILNDPLATPAQLIGRLEEFTRQVARSSRQYVGLSKGTPDDALGMINDIFGPDKPELTVKELREKKDAGEISEMDYIVEMQRIAGK